MSGWNGSTRSQRLPPGWHTTTRPRILRRDGHRCRHTLPDGTRCPWTDPTGHTLEIDHRTPGDNHHPDNLQTLCGQGSPANHHQQKTLTERRPPTPRPPEPHPSLLTPDSTGGG